MDKAISVLAVVLVIFLFMLGVNAAFDSISGALFSGDTEQPTFAGLTQSQYAALVEVNALQTGQAAHQAGLANIIGAEGDRIPAGWYC